jgi:hypothetical protein
MIDIVSTSFYIKAPDFGKEDFEQYSSQLFDEWDRYVEDNLNLTDYSLTLVVEEGSIKGKGKIAASLAVLYFGIGNYGDFISGLKTIQDQTTYVTTALYNQAKTTFGCTSASGHFKKGGGAVSYLRSLFYQVQRGALTPEEAIERVKVRFGDEAVSLPEFLNDLQSSLAQAPKAPEQLTLIDDSWLECPETPISERERPTRLPSPLPMPISHHYRIEISRESKTDRKKVKITKMKR